MLTRIAVGECLREVLEVAGLPRCAVRPPPAVRPAWRSPERDQKLDATLLRAPDEVVDVVQPVGGIE